MAESVALAPASTIYIYWTESGAACWGDNNIMLAVSGRAGEHVCRYQTINNITFTPVSPILAACYI